MKKVLLLIGLCLWVSAVSAKQGADLPYDDLELLADSIIESCSICVTKLRRIAFDNLEKRFKPGTIITTGEKAFFVVNDDCEENELVLQPYVSRKLYLKDYKIKKKKVDVYLPLITYRFHTTDNKLVGIKKNDITGKKVLKEYSSHKKKQALYRGSIQIISYPYGDKAGFNFFSKKNKLQVHCKVTRLEYAGDSDQ